jgi:small conductance mechanosensitive channel
MKEEFETWLTGLVEWIFSSGIKIVFIVIIAYALKIISKRFIQRLVKAAVSSDKVVTTDAEMKRMKTLTRIFSWTINVVIIVIASMMIIQEFGVQIGPILASAGIVGVAIGFGGQYLVKDVITGFFIIFENQYRIGDVISVLGISGTVEDISLRVTTLRDDDGTVHYIPHGEIKQVSNLTKTFAKVNLKVGISYDADIDQVATVVNKVGKELAEDPQWKEYIDEAPHFLRIDDFEDSAVKIKIVGVTKPQMQWSVTGELRKRLKEAFDEELIELPFPQQVVHFANAPKQK